MTRRGFCGSLVGLFGVVVTVPTPETVAVTILIDGPQLTKAIVGGDHIGENGVRYVETVNGLIPLRPWTQKYLSDMGVVTLTAMTK